jgi:hypothetical protein
MKTFIAIAAVLFLSGCVTGDDLELCFRNGISVPCEK